jgi:histidinol-phosphate aminotransferase
MMVQATASRRTKLIAAEPTFEAVTGYSLPETYVRESVPLDNRLAHDIGKMRELAERSWDPVLVYVCNPNNPTGTLTPCSEVDEWIESAPENVRFLVDEAYFEYVNDSEYSSSIKWILDRPNVVVARTFSKIYGMAGIRLGYGVAHPDTVEHLAQFAADTNTNELALRAGLASLNDQGLVARSVDVNRRGAEIVREVLGELELEVFPSHTNFVMHRIGGELQTYIGRMREHGILVGRPFPPMLTYSRLSIGLPEEMARFAETLREFRQNGWV